MPDAQNVVRSAYQRNPQADFFIFDMRTPDGRAISARRRYPPGARELPLLGVWSCMISFRRRAVVDGGAHFDERFGINGEYEVGEENVFLFDNARAGRNIVFDPRVVALHPLDSSRRKLTEPSVIEAKGAMVARLFPQRYRLYNALAAARMYPRYFRSLCPWQFYRLLGAGSHRFLETRGG